MMKKKGYVAVQAYANSKLANIHHGKELGRRLEGTTLILRTAYQKCCHCQGSLMHSFLFNKSRFNQLTNTRSSEYPAELSVFARGKFF